MRDTSTLLPHRNTGSTTLNGRLLNYPVHQLQPHPSYVRHKLSVQTCQLAALEDQGELAFQYPIIITEERFIIDGYARWELAKRQGRSGLLAIEYDLTEFDALQLLIQTHRRFQGLNDFLRIELALDMEAQFKEQAFLNRREGGRFKALSTLTKAEKIDSRREVARLAHVSVGNVHKVKCILANACSALQEAARTGEISINLVEKWAHEPEAEQQENLRLNRIARGIRKKVRKLVAAQVALMGLSKAEQQVIRLADFLKFIHQLSVIIPKQTNELGSIEVKLAKDCGGAILVPEDLFSVLALQESVHST